MLKEALEIVLHDAFFIDVKLHRALDGCDRYDHDGEDDSHPVQNDWNGSAKVALISLERSVPAWRVIAQATGDEAPWLLADQLRDLQREVESAFPHARSFIRPGFDEPDCRRQTPSGCVIRQIAGHAPSVLLDIVIS